MDFEEDSRTISQALNDLYADWLAYVKRPVIVRSINPAAEVAELERMYGDGPERS